MLTIEKTVLPSPEQWEIIIEGMRNPMNSWDKSDSKPGCRLKKGRDCVNWEFHKDGDVTFCDECTWCESLCGDAHDREHHREIILGKNDHNLMTKLVKGGSVHAKYRRMIPVMFTVTAPTFWWIEFDTYKVGTVRNSCSKMHKIHVEPFTPDNFSHEGCDEVPLALGHLEDTVDMLEYLRQKFNETQDKRYWRALLELLPHGYNMKATISLNYEVLANIYYWRWNHKVDEWHTFCDWIRGLPYSELIIGGADNAVD